MKAGSIPLLKFLQNAPQFIIPIYQRKYSWEIEQCQQLWNDILNAGRSGNFYEHFFGAIVYVADHELHDSPLLVIDGQQRLTTILSYRWTAKINYHKFAFAGFSARTR